ncbi:MAG: VOC family protein [Alphaproteobacteria bacterium]|nr:VOC family protein [Alphaproteobacteria bacterium]
MQLGQLGFEVHDVGAWSAFLAEVVGLQPVGDGRWRMDGHAWRFQVTEGPADDLSYVSWELAPEAFDATVARLRTAGVEVVEADPDARDVQRRVTFVDPAGIPTELTTGNARQAAPPELPLVPHGFVADALGLGHVVLSTRDKAASVRFYTELLGARLSDHIVCQYFGHDVDLSFFHVNARHHSVAFGGPQRHRLNHFMLEATWLDDVGLAYDRAIRSGTRIHQTLGRHPNDGMLSFYARTPSGFQYEIGWGGVRVDDATWQPGTHHAISTWGHHPPAVAFPGRPR